MLTGSATIGVMRSAHVKMPTLRRRHQAKALTTSGSRTDRRPSIRNIATPLLQKFTTRKPQTMRIIQRRTYLPERICPHAHKYTKVSPFRAASLFAKSEGRKLALHFPCGRKPDPGQACRMASDTMAAGKRTSAKEWSNSGQVNLLMRVQLAYIFSAERVRIPRDDILWRIQANARHRGRARLLLHSTRPKQTSA